MNISYKYSCVIDADSIHQDTLLVHIIPQPDGTTKDEIQFYTLKPSERLIDTRPPTRRPHAGAEGLVRPHWDGQAWEEAATAAEIKRWEQEHPAPTVEPPPSSPVDVLGAQVVALSLENMQKDMTINALGTQLAQTSLDVMILKSSMMGGEK